MLKSVTTKLVISITALAATATPVLAQSADWNKQVARIIASKQSYPRVAQMRGEEGTARVKIYVGADGAVQRSELVGGSGSPTLDKEAIALPSRIGTLPAPPGGATSVTVPFTWKLI